jgi:TonB family protein
METTVLHLTLVDQTNLIKRLSTELEYFATQTAIEWRRFKIDPASYLNYELYGVSKRLLRWARSTNAITGASTAFTIVLTAVLIVIASDRTTHKNKLVVGSESEYASVLDLENVPLFPSSSSDGFAKSGPGRVGMNKGSGEGSNPEPARSHGGGGGGDHQHLPPQQGAVPLPTEIPAPIPALPIKNQALPVAGVNLDPALWKALPFAQYGDPRSSSDTTSNGPGSDGGMGTGTGTGVGEGTGPGLGPGRDGNTGNDANQPGGDGTGGGGPGCGQVGCTGLDRIFRSAEVAQRARVLLKPEPQYTEEARRNQITGTVILRVVFSKFGEVTEIRAIQALPSGLTERAIAAARKIRFLPAMKEGRPVSVYMQLEYNFNLY